MKKVLYISNIEVPYRVKFFNLLSEKCELTVLYEREKSDNRNASWAKSEKKQYQVKYLNGFNTGRESSFSLGILREIFGDYDTIIVGCYNSPVQMLAILVMKACGIKFSINLDGEPFFVGSGLKDKVKRFFLSGAQSYLVAGEKAADSLRKVLGNCKVIPYYFSSLTEQELAEHRETVQHCMRDGTVLVVGQYYDYKGMDVALEAARLDPGHKYKLVGMGTRAEKFFQDYSGKIPPNVEIVPFLQKTELEEEYKRCAVLVLPSRQECWGLVINEAASFGMPIVSTWGSGAAVEILGDRYPRFLAKPGDAESLFRCVQLFFDEEDNVEYSHYLLEKSKKYSIEQSVFVHINEIESEVEN